MIIYSNNLAEKLFGYAISRDFLKYSSPFCDLVDDPDLKLDFDLAILFNKGLNGDQEAVKQFTEDFIANGPALDVSTINFYVSKINVYPAFSGEIQRVNYVLGNYTRIPEAGDYNSRFANLLKEAFKDCWNSPCNYFSQNSDSVAKLAESTANMNLTTMPSFGQLFGEVSTALGGMGKDLWNRVPGAFSSSFYELAAIGQTAWSECTSMFTSKVETEELIKKARSGVSLRGGQNAQGYIYTPDFKSYLDHSSAASNILGKTAARMGDCFRQYQQAYRYNAYDSEMNLSTSNKSQVNDQSNGVVYKRDITGPSINTGGTDQTNSEQLGLTPEFIRKIFGGSKTAASKYDTDTERLVGDTARQGASGKLYYEFIVRPGEQVTYFGAWYDKESSTIWSDDYNTTENDEYTLRGVGSIYSTEYIYCPSVPYTGTSNKGGYQEYIERGYTNNEDYTTLVKNKFNNGVALKLRDVEKYGVDLKNVVVEITYKNRVYSNINVIDTGSLAANARLDATPWLLYKIGGNKPKGINFGEAFLNNTRIVRKVQLDFGNTFEGMKVRVLRKN